MRTLLLIVNLSLFSSLYAAGGVSYELNEQTKLITEHCDARGITDTCNNIKNSTKNALEGIKKFADNTKDKIKQWNENVKKRAQIAKEKMQDRIKNIRTKSKIALEKLIGTGKLVKECFQKENAANEELLKQIIKHVTSCISNALIHLEKLGLQLELNETNFISEVENKINKCETEKDEEECLHKVRQDMYSSTEKLENNVLASRMESRSITDDILDAVILCSVEGLVDSSIVIANESIQIIKCVVKG